MTIGDDIKLDMEADSLQVKTDSTVGSGERLGVQLYNEQGVKLGVSK